MGGERVSERENERTEKGRKGERVSERDKRTESERKGRRESEQERKTEKGEREGGEDRE